MKTALRENAHMFENKIRDLESGTFIVDHHPRCAASDLNREVRPPIPGVHLAHTGIVQTVDWRADIGDVLRVVGKRHRLSVLRT